MKKVTKIRLLLLVLAGCLSCQVTAETRFLKTWYLTKLHLPGASKPEMAILSYTEGAQHHVFFMAGKKSDLQGKGLRYEAVDEDYIVVGLWGEPQAFEGHVFYLTHNKENLTRLGFDKQYAGVHNGQHAKFIYTVLPVKIEFQNFTQSWEGEDITSPAFKIWETSLSLPRKEQGVIPKQYISCYHNEQDAPSVKTPFNCKQCWPEKDYSTAAAILRRLAQGRYVYLYSEKGEAIYEDKDDQIVITGLRSRGAVCWPPPIENTKLQRAIKRKIYRAYPFCKKSSVHDPDSPRLIARLKGMRTLKSLAAEELKLHSFF